MSTSELTSSVEQEFKLLEQQWGEIFVRVDAAALNHLLMEDFIYTSARGEVLHKQQYLANLSSGEVRMTAEDYTDLEVRHYKDVAIVTGVVTLKAQYRGQDISGSNLFTKVWVKHEGRWRSLALHACLLPQ